MMDLGDAYQLSKKIIHGLDRKSSNTDLNQAETTKTDSSSSTTGTKEKKKKKSSWFNAFYPTYKSRSEDFKRIFKEVPDDQRLVVDYSCAVQKEILVHGRLYVTQNFLCFYANIFGWETNIVLKWKDVAAITKEKTALVIPNAILISTKTEKYFFTSFVARDKVYLMLFRVWQNALMDKQMSNQEMWQWVHQSYGAELGLTSDDEDYIAPGTEEEKISVKAELESPQLEVANTGESGGSSGERLLEENGSSNNCSSTNSKEMSTKAQGSSDLSDTDYSDLDIPAQCDIQSVSCTCAHEGRQLLNEILPLHVDQLFTLLFTNSKFFLDFHASRKTTDLSQTPWTQDSTDNSKSRTVNLTIALTQALGPKTSQVTEKQIMLPCSKAGVLYAINMESTSGGVPYADSFYIEAHYCIKKVSEKQSSLAVYAQVKFRKSIWGLVKGMIEKNCWSGLEEFYSSLSKALQAEGEEYVPDVKRKTKRKRKLHSAPRIEVPVARADSVAQVKETSMNMLTSERATVFIFLVLVLLLVLNVMLYHKLWSLEEEQPPNNLLNLQLLLKNPPATQDEWLKLLQKQDRLHTEEVKKWYETLRAAINSLKQAETILMTLQQSTNPQSTSSFNVDDVETGASTEKTLHEDL
ncbi:hypothetical protein HHI36_017629 [Cryptolaemus montrouzieri]|uniref:VASt domain-containing protein n=1 Tax=Cryptolaemus montrouzieri TaxID=559131 RepID=A0ABD2NNG4_9CUCU